jgi:hypothetical protein
MSEGIQRMVEKRKHQVQQSIKSTTCFAQLRRGLKTALKFSSRENLHYYYYP